jgi:hypothetical protein
MCVTGRHVYSLTASGAVLNLTSYPLHSLEKFSGEVARNMCQRFVLKGCIKNIFFDYSYNKFRIVVIIPNVTGIEFAKLLHKKI